MKDERRMSYAEWAERFGGLGRVPPDEWARYDAAMAEWIALNPAVMQDQSDRDCKPDGSCGRFQNYQEAQLFCETRGAPDLLARENPDNPECAGETERGLFSLFLYLSMSALKTHQDYQDRSFPVPFALDRQPAQALVTSSMPREVPDDRLVEANLRIDIWDLLQAGLLAERSVARLETGDTVGLPLRTETPFVWLGEIRIEVAWDTPMPNVPRPWWCCPGCKRRCRFIYLRGDDGLGCWRCLGLQHFCQSRRRQLTGTATVMRLRKKLGASGDAALPFSPLPPRRRGERREYYHRIIAMIIAAERRLLLAR